jgi:transposase InsO family protein
MKTPAGSVILWVTSAGTTLPRSMPEVSQSFFALLQKNVLNTRRWETRAELRLAMVTWIETKYNRRRRQRGLGKLTPAEFEMIYKDAEAA